jgi:hypothetical protein
MAVMLMRNGRSPTHPVVGEWRHEDNDNDGNDDEDDEETTER